MTNPEGEVAASNTSPKEVGNSPAASENVIKSEFLDKVSEIPMVNAAKEYGTAAYNQVKGLNRFTAAALTVAETTALYFAMTAKPLLEKVQPQAQLVDTLACRGLVAVEEKVPFLLKPPEQLVEDARKLCSSTVEMGYQKVEEIRNLGTETLSTVKSYGLQKANDAISMGYQNVEEIRSLGTETLSTVKSYGLQKANDAISETEDLVNKYLPPAFGEGSQEAASESNSVPERAVQLTSKIGLRLYGHGIKQLLTVHKLSQESVTRLVYTVELLQQLKEHYASKSVQEYVDEAKIKATWIWEELNKEPSEATEPKKSLEQRMLSLARRTTSILVHAYNITALPVASLPQTYREGVTTASKYASELFSQFDQATNAGEVTSSFLHGVHEKLVSLQKVIQGLTSQTEEFEMVEMESSTSEDAKDDHKK